MTVINTENEPQKLIKIIETNKDIIDGAHIIVAFTAMQKFYKEHNYKIQDIQNDTHFLKMLFILNKYLITLDLPQTIQAFRLLYFFQISSNSNIFQSILQLIRNSVNDLELSHIYALFWRLKQMNQNNLTAVIRVALPEVFKAQVKFQIDRDNIDELIGALLYMSKENIIDQDILEFIMKGFDKCKQEINPLAAKDIYIALAKMRDLPDCSISTLEKVEKVIMENIDFYNLNLKNLILQSLIFKLEKG